MSYVLSSFVVPPPWSSAGSSSFVAAAVETRVNAFVVAAAVAGPRGAVVEVLGVVASCFRARRLDPAQDSKVRHSRISCLVCS